jgi:hypothetical protein
MIDEEKQRDKFLLALERQWQIDKAASAAQSNNPDQAPPPDSIYEPRWRNMVKSIIKRGLP